MGKIHQWFIIIAAGLLASMTGCAAPPDGDQQRLARVTERLTAACEPAGRTIRAGKIPGRAMAAYSWPDGRVRVTRGLLAAVDDDELSAAVAHELAHLLADGHLRSRASALRGSAAAGLDVESRADLLGRELLAACDIDPQAMVRLLERLAASATASSPRLRNQLRSRIEVLATTPAP